jgi:transcriptional regulator with GAF, ATPase, and Fis domain
MTKAIDPATQALALVATLQATVLDLERRLRATDARVSQLEARLAALAPPPSPAVPVRTQTSPAAKARAAAASRSDEAERKRIIEALEATNWNRMAAAERLGVSRRTFYRYAGRLGILAGEG